MEINRKSMKKTNSRQFHKMVQLMEQNPNVASGLGKFGSSKVSHKESWKSFAVELNSLRPPLREGKEWHKVWLDFRLKTKKKLSLIRTEATETGGGPNRQLSLSPLEQAVDALLNLSHAAAPSGQYFGDTTVNQTATISISANENSFAADEEEDEEEVAVDENTPPVRKSKSQLATERDEERINILKKQTDAQAELLLKTTNIEKHLHDIARYTRKMYDVKAEKINILKAKERRKEREMLDANRRHRETVELQSQIIAIKKLKYGAV